MSFERPTCGSHDGGISFSTRGHAAKPERAVPSRGGKAAVSTWALLRTHVEYYMVIRMSTRMRTLSALFTSGVRAKALRRLILAGDQEIGERSLAREEKLPVGAMRRELDRLGGAGLVKTRLSRRRRFHRAN